MSSQTKDPLENTSSESSESSPSDSDVSDAEENMEHLKIDERSSKEAKVKARESKPLDPSNQERTLTSKDLNEPVAGASGLQSSRGSSDPNLALSDPNKDDENIGVKMLEGDSDTTDTSSSHFQSSSTSESFSLTRDNKFVGFHRPEFIGVSEKEASAGVKGVGEEPMIPTRRTRHDVPLESDIPTRRTRHDNPLETDIPTRRTRHDTPLEAIFPPRMTRHDVPLEVREGPSDVSPRMTRHDTPLEAREESSDVSLGDSEKLVIPPIPQRRTWPDTPLEAREGPSDISLGDGEKLIIPPRMTRHDTPLEAREGPSYVDLGDSERIVAPPIPPRKTMHVAPSGARSGPCGVVEGDEQMRPTHRTGDSDSSSSRVIQSSTGVNQPSWQENKYKWFDRPSPFAKYDYLFDSSRGSSSDKRGIFATDSANTSSDISEIRSEVVDVSTEGSPYQSASENPPKADSPSVYLPALESLSSDNSEANTSELQDEHIFSATPSGSSTSISSISISTPSGQQGHRAYLEQLQREADERGAPISTSSGIGSTNQSELAHLQRWGLVGAMAGYRRDNEDVHADNPEHGQGEEQMEDESISQDQRMPDFDNLFQQNVEESNVATGDAARGIPVEPEIKTKVKVRSPRGRKKASKSFSKDHSSESEEIIRLRPRTRSDPGRKKATVAKRLSVAKQSGLESPEPKSSSSDDEMRRKESPDIKSSSKSHGDSSYSKKSKKPWQKSGRLRSMQLPTASSKECAITEEEEDQISQGDREPEPMAIKDSSPEKMETTPEKVVQDSSPTEPSASSDQTYTSDSTLKDQMIFQVSEFERTVGQTKRPGGKLSSSPPAEGRLSSTPPKESTSRPKKKTRDESHGPTRRTRHDSGDPDRRGSDEETRL